MSNNENSYYNAVYLKGKILESKTLINLLNNQQIDAQWDAISDPLGSLYAIKHDPPIAFRNLKTSFFISYT